MPTGSRYQGTDEQKVSQFSELKILGGHDRGLNCQKKSSSTSEKATVTLADYFGPGKTNLSLISEVMLYITFKYI